jgi:hypothetical protein
MSMLGEEGGGGMTPAEAKALGLHILTYPLSGIYAATK